MGIDDALTLACQSDCMVYDISSEKCQRISRGDGLNSSIHAFLEAYCMRDFHKHLLDKHYFLVNPLSYRIGSRWLCAIVTCSGFVELNPRGYQRNE